MIVTVCALSLWVIILSIGTSTIEPISRVRQGCIQFFIKLVSRLHTIFGFWVYCTYEYIEWDYEEYLGKQTNTEEKKPISTIVCNHLGFIEIYNLLLTPLCPSFCAKSELKKAPVISGIA